MNLRDLEYFNCLCESKSFTETAKLLYVSQPSITISLRRLEKELNIELVIRDHNKNKFSLTEAGKVLEKHTKNILQEIKETSFEISKLTGSKIKLGVPPIIGAYFFPPLMKKLIKNNLAQKIELVEKGSAAMKNLIITDDVDMALLGSLAPIENADINSTILKEDAFMVCVSKNNPLAKEAKLSINDIKEEKFIVLGDSYIHNKVFNDLCLKNNISPANVYYTDEIQTAKSLIASDLGIGIMINMAVKNMDTIKAIPLSTEILFYISIVIKKNHYMTLQEKNIKAVLTENINYL
ncbi:LysR family transcriptional regulator [Clostridium felsineum]|uniref:LysR family transcriptional regulator n=1 Tax=Clostridium felsineum TaxID=36839 RepID=UPI00098CD1E7|nr:LysR family transcriptional regulator [Clostridium felsineum]URZ16475.1 HTH-type transcriptional regulator CynR [Clostridium felsineum DSM 794]